MKLLLTSAGLTNQLLKDTFLELVVKTKNISVAYITTASNVEKNKDFIKRNQNNLQSVGDVKIFDIDISNENNRPYWSNILSTADVIWIDGGNTFYLLDILRQTGLDKDLKNILGEKLFVGVSAGSIVVTPSIAIAKVEPSDPNIPNIHDLRGLGWVDFEISPHTPEYITLASAQKYAKKISNPLYVLDDQSAIKVVEDNISIISQSHLAHKL